MKIKFQYIWLLALITCMASCKKDNYEAPSSALTGKIHYKGDPIQVEFNRVTFELYQYGYKKVGPIRQVVSPEGTYSSLLFDGQYKMIFPNGQGPFKWPKTAAGNPDTVSISVAGNQTLDIEVVPYYMVRTPVFAIAAGKVTASFKAEKIVTDATGKDIEEVTLYINKTQFASSDFNIAKTVIAGSAITNPNSISMEVTVPALVPTQNYIFARLSIKIAGIEDRIFSPVQKLTF